MAQLGFPLMILICVNEVAGPTGYHKSVVELANGLHRAGYPVAMLSFVGAADGSERMLPLWPLDKGVPAFALQTLTAQRGRLLHRNFHPALSGSVSSVRYSLTANQLAALRQLNGLLSEEDTVIFTSPLQSTVFRQAIDGDERRARTMLQIHGDYQHHAELWDPLIESRSMIDRLQTVAGGLRAQFIPTFADSEVVFVPNFPGDNGSAVEKVKHDGINIALPASFQHRKNQLDAVRALALIDDPSVHLTLWGTANRFNPYFVGVQQLVESLGLGDRVHMPGFGTETDIYSTADIVLMTSLSEGFGYPLIEAAHHGLPAVTFDYEFGPRDAIEDGQSGYIVELGDVQQLAAKLSALAHDESLRAAFGRRAQEVYLERFSNEAVTEQYRRLLGDGGDSLDVVEAFSTDGVEPVSPDVVSHKVRRARTSLIHEVKVTSPLQLYDIQIDDGERVVAPAVRRANGVTRIEFRSSGAEVISYVTAPGSDDRHYLANTRGSELEILPYLRRDAGYGSGVPPVIDTLFASSGGAKRLTGGRVVGEFANLARRAPRDIAWKIRQISRPTKARSRVPDAPSAAHPAPDLPNGTTSRGAEANVPSPSAARPDPSEPRRTMRGSRLPISRLSSLGRVAISLGKAATSAVVMRLTVNTPAPTRREVPRHPLYPVTSGLDSFGTPVNTAGGVVVQNTGSPRQPTVSISGEYDWLILRDAVAERRVSAPFSYGEMFERICTAERERGLFEIATRDGVHLWELGRSALIIQLAEAAGLWGPSNAIGAPVSDVYNGPKRLMTAPRVRRVVFDYARRGQSGYRTAAFRDDETMFIVQPEADGYPEVDDTNLVYPFYEFNRWRQDPRRRWAQLRVPEVDARPFEAALADALGIRIDLGDHLRNRLAKFLAEREFWTPVFERLKPEEVMISSSHWWAGIAAAAARSGARVSDIQYALTSHYAPSFWFGGTPHHGATRFYAWSEYWAARTNVYKDHVVVPRQQPEFAAAQSREPGDPVWDVCVISQPRVLRRILAFVKALVQERPELKIVIAPHPAQRPIIHGELASAGVANSVTVAPNDTLTTIGQSAICVGTFSTSLWEAAALGRPTYVIPVPGYEETLQDIESGLFRLAESPHDLVPFEVPDSSRRIFGDL